MALFFFMMVFMDTTATIPTGAMAERWAGRTSASSACGSRCRTASTQLGVGRRLARAGRHQLGLGHGAVDFAGSGVVHAMGGVIALAGAHGHRPRIGKVRRRQSRRRCPATTSDGRLGTFILAFGWFGFNPGSTLAGTDLRISYVVVNTMLAGVTGALARDGHARC
jgi:Amt family ammonium transporter